MDLLLLVGRVLFAVLFLQAAVAHLKHGDGMAGWASSRGLPAAKQLVLLSGLWILAGSLMVILGAWADLGFLMLGAFAFVAAFLLHNFWRDEDPMEGMRQQTQFMKNLALGGAAIVMFVFFAAAADAIGLQLTGPLFSLDL